MTLDDTRVGATVTIQTVCGSGSFRRRLLELGLLPGTRVTVVRVAPLRDPIELWIRGGSLSIRRAEAAQVDVHEVTKPEVSRTTQRHPSLRPEPWLENAS